MSAPAHLLLMPQDREQSARERALVGALTTPTHARSHFELQRDLKLLEARLADNQKMLDGLGDLIDLEDAPRLEKAQGSVFHKLLEAIDADTVRWPLFDERPFVRLDVRDAAVFVIEHDWADAFKGAAEFAEGDFRLPFSQTCLELKVSGHRVCAIFFDDDPEGDYHMFPCVHGNTGWSMLAPCRLRDGKWAFISSCLKDNFSRLVNLIGQQARAMAVALDSEVAVSEIIRAPHKLNAAREKRGALPLRDYHVISLARRSRAAPLASGAGSEGTRKRLHFRRGHWRHYEDHKTWIRWTLVGNPDLGFIDKHYRL